MIFVVFTGLFLANSISYYYQLEPDRTSYRYYDLEDGESSEKEEKKAEEDEDEKVRTDIHFPKLAHFYSLRKIILSDYFESLHDPESMTPPPESSFLLS